MPYPRYLLVPPNVSGTYHCVSRCVRRAFLCGTDPDTGQSFNHRKQWLEDRIVELAAIFAVAVHAYAVMDNHFHLVVETNPDAPSTWSDDEVARRWLLLSSGTPEQGSPLSTRIALLVESPDRLAVLRQRLGSLSWFMRYLKEPLARLANLEDGCTGRFWEGRFRTQALLDDAAVLAVMAYVDLNPIRAGIATTPEQSAHTSAKRRAGNQHSLEQPLRPIATSIETRPLEMSNAQYLQLVGWTGRALHCGSENNIRAKAPTVIERIGLRPRQWLLQVPATETRYWRVIGHADSMIEHARRVGKKWFRGIGLARSLARLGDISAT